jgi:hypothetical protein
VVDGRGVERRWKNEDVDAGNVQADLQVAQTNCNDARLFASSYIRLRDWTDRRLGKPSLCTLKGDLAVSRQPILTINMASNMHHFGGPPQLMPPEAVTCTDLAIT